MGISRQRKLVAMEDAAEAPADTALAAGAFAFVEVGAAHGAFRRWTGATPAEWRARTWR
jgi:hypothetical protein